MAEERVRAYGTGEEMAGDFYISYNNAGNEDGTVREKAGTRRTTDSCSDTDFGGVWDGMDGAAGGSGRTESIYHSGRNRSGGRL